MFGELKKDGLNKMKMRIFKKQTCVLISRAVLGAKMRNYQKGVYNKKISR